MLSCAFAGMMGMATAQDAAPSSASAPVPAPSTARSVGGISDAAIREAVRAALADEPKTAVIAERDSALSGDRYREFSRQFSEAEKPSCLGPDALTHQPAEYATKRWVFGLGGILALPFWGAAIVRGKCN